MPRYKPTMVYVHITSQDVYQQYVRAVAQNIRPPVPQVNMGSRRSSSYQHPLAQLFQGAAESLTSRHLATHRLTHTKAPSICFTTYLGAHHPQVLSLEQLRRDPLILGWLTPLGRSRTPSLARYTMIARIVRLRRVLEELAWAQQLPTLAHLLRAAMIFRGGDHHLPRPLTPDQDQRIQQELRRSRRFHKQCFGYCSVTPACASANVSTCQWMLPAPTRARPVGHPRASRQTRYRTLGSVDSVVCRIIDRLRSLRPPTAPDAGRLLLPRPRGRYMPNSQTPAPLCRMPLPRLELPPASSRTNFDTPTPVKCSGARRWPPCPS